MSDRLVPLSSIKDRFFCYRQAENRHGIIRADSTSSSPDWITSQPLSLDDDSCFVDFSPSIDASQPYQGVLAYSHFAALIDIGDSSKGRVVADLTLQPYSLEQLTPRASCVDWNAYNNGLVAIGWDHRVYLYDLNWMHTTPHVPVHPPFLSDATQPASCPLLAPPLSIHPHEHARPVSCRFVGPSTLMIGWTREAFSPGSSAAGSSRVSGWLTMHDLLDAASYRSTDVQKHTSAAVDGLTVNGLAPEMVAGHSMACEGKGLIEVIDRRRFGDTFRRLEVDGPVRRVRWSHYKRLTLGEMSGDDTAADSVRLRVFTPAEARPDCHPLLYPSARAITPEKNSLLMDFAFCPTDKTGVERLICLHQDGALSTTAPCPRPVPLLPTATSGTIDPPPFSSDVLMPAASQDQPLPNGPLTLPLAEKSADRSLEARMVDWWRVSDGTELMRERLAVGEHGEGEEDSDSGRRKAAVKSVAAKGKRERLLHGMDMSEYAAVLRQQAIRLYQYLPPSVLQQAHTLPNPREPIPIPLPPTDRRRTKLNDPTTSTQRVSFYGRLAYRLTAAAEIWTWVERVLDMRDGAGHADENEPDAERGIRRTYRGLVDCLKGKARRESDGTKEADLRLPKEDDTGLVENTLLGDSIMVYTSSKRDAALAFLGFGPSVDASSWSRSNMAAADPSAAVQAILTGILFLRADLLLKAALLVETLTPYAKEGGLEILRHLPSVIASFARLMTPQTGEGAPSVEWDVNQGLWRVESDLLLHRPLSDWLGLPHGLTLRFAFHVILAVTSHIDRSTAKVLDYRGGVGAADGPSRIRRLMETTAVKRVWAARQEDRDADKEDVNGEEESKVDAPAALFEAILLHLITNPFLSSRAVPLPTAPPSPDKPPPTQPLTDSTDSDIYSYASMRFRAALALRYLSPAVLQSWLNSEVTVCCRDGLLDGFWLVGVAGRPYHGHGEGEGEGGGRTIEEEMVRRYVNCTGDLQAPALFAAATGLSRPHQAAIQSVQHPQPSPHQPFVLIQLLFHEYRALLQRWGRTLQCIDLLVLETSHPDMSGRRDKEKDKGGAGGPVAVVPRGDARHCWYCNEALTGPGQPSLARKTLRPSDEDDFQLSFRCPNTHCKKELTKCAICLMPVPRLNTAHDGAKTNGSVAPTAQLDVSKWFVWCTLCHHGGCADHMLEWFHRYGFRGCPVPDCNCHCDL